MLRELGGRSVGVPTGGRGSEGGVLQKHGRWAAAKLINTLFHLPLAFFLEVIKVSHIHLVRLLSVFIVLNCGTLIFSILL